MKKMQKIRIRKSVRKTIFVLLLVSIVVAMVTLYDSFNSENKKKFVNENIYEYTNKYLYSYDVSMLENGYVTEKNIGDKNVYITNLMDVANINMTYLYNANQVSDISYSYKIVGNLESVYVKDGEEQRVFKNTEVLVENKDFTVNSKDIEISESFELNIKDKIQMIKNFQQEVGMQVDTTYTVVLEVMSKTNIMGQEVLNVYSPNLVFEIGPKTTKLKTTTEESSKPQIITKKSQMVDQLSEVKRTVATIVLIIAIILILVLKIKTVDNNVIKNEYKIELNRILKECEEKIVEVNDKIDTDRQNLIDVIDFNEVIKLSEELSKPILYWNNENLEESWFCVIGDKILYRYILKR